MLPKYTIEYTAQFGRQSQNYHYSSDDPVACEEFLAELLERGFRIKTIRHEGLELAKADFDKYAYPVESRCRCTDGISADFVGLLRWCISVICKKRPSGSHREKHFDKFIKTAAGMLAAKSICKSLGISTEEAHHRFGFTA